MSKKIRIVGGKPINGTIKISGAKNSALPLIAASILAEKELVLNNVPNLEDIKTMLELLESLGMEINHTNDVVSLNSSNINNFTAHYDLVRKMRASILVLGPLLAKYKKAVVSLPGGCAIGTRPVDLHLAGLKAMGAEINIDQGYIHASAPKDGLIGTEITIPKISVGGTENLMMAATLANGRTVISNAAREPEIVDLAICLNSMGAKITGFGTDKIIIDGVQSLAGCNHKVMPDRIETGTYAMAALITHGDVRLVNTDLSLITIAAAVLEKAGGIITKHSDGFSIKSSVSRPKGIDVMTEAFPGFATDLQAQFMALMTINNSASMITETIFENRFMHVPELCRMGANITIHGSSALVRGVEFLTGAQIMATDLRASVSLVIAALSAKGESFIDRIYHLDRGYENLETKLGNCGAMIERIKSN